MDDKTRILSALQARLETLEDEIARVVKEAASAGPSQSESLWELARELQKEKREVLAELQNYRGFNGCRKNLRRLRMAFRRVREVLA